MISINTNYGGLFASKAASQSQRILDTAMERLSTGKRINYATDDAAGQAIATRLQAEIQGIAMATRNVADAQSLMDTADGLAAGSSRCLEAMDDSRVGASGVQAAFIVLLLQFSALVQLDGFAPAALVMASIFARVSPLWAMGRFRYLRRDGTAAFHRSNWCGWREGLPALLLVVVTALLLFWLQPEKLAALAGVVLLGTLSALIPAEWLGRHLGGHTGDSYGATLMICETLTLLGSALLAPVLLAAA